MSISEQLNEMADIELSDLIELAREIQRERARARGDVEALIEEGFTHGFDQNGAAKAPWIVEGVLICAGSLLKRSGTSHDCGFVKVNDEWVWMSRDLLCDEVRWNDEGAKGQMRSVSLVAVDSGTRVDFIMSSKRAGLHKMKKARSYDVANGELSLVSTRSVASADLEGHQR